MAKCSAEVFDFSRPAAADLSAKQFYAVKISGANVALCAAVTDIAVGILRNKPIAGEAASVRQLGITEAITDGSGTAIAAGDALGPNASGKLVKVTTADRPVVARALEASTTDGAIINVLMTPGAVYRTPA